MSLQQINVAYNPTEDRLLLRITGNEAQGLAEFRFLITRRLLRLLWGGLDKLLDAGVAADPRVDAGARGMMKQFEKEAALASADFKTPYAPQAKAAEVPVLTPLGEAPVLVSRVQLRPLAPGHYLVGLHNETGQGITLTLAPEMIHSIRKLLADSAQKAEWNLDLMENDEKVVGGGPEPGRIIN